MEINELLEKGYKEYSPNAEFEVGVNRVFQKRFDDDFGKRYFITVRTFKPWTHPYTHEEFTSEPEFDIQLYSSNGHKPLNLKFFSGWSIDEVENYVLKIFNLHDLNGKHARMFDWYEEWEEENERMDNR